MGLALRPANSPKLGIRWLSGQRGSRMLAPRMGEFDRREIAMVNITIGNLVFCNSVWKWLEKGSGNRTTDSQPSDKTTAA